MFRAMRQKNDLADILETCVSDIDLSVSQVASKKQLFFISCLFLSINLYKETAIFHFKLQHFLTKLVK